MLHESKMYIPTFESINPCGHQIIIGFEVECLDFNIKKTNIINPTNFGDQQLKELIKEHYEYIIKH